MTICLCLTRTGYFFFLSFSSLAAVPTSLRPTLISLGLKQSLSRQTSRFPATHWKIVKHSCLCFPGDRCSEQNNGIVGFIASVRAEMWKSKHHNLYFVIFLVTSWICKKSKILTGNVSVQFVALAKTNKQNVTCGSLNFLKLMFCLTLTDMLDWVWINPINQSGFEPEIFQCPLFVTSQIADFKICESSHT